MSGIAFIVNEVNVENRAYHGLDDASSDSIKVSLTDSQSSAALIATFSSSTRKVSIDEVGPFQLQVSYPLDHFDSFWTTLQFVLGQGNVKVRMNTVGEKRIQFSAESKIPV